ncbi:MAG: ATP-binding protein [Oscillospiraceae bacterium]
MISCSYLIFSFSTYWAFLPCLYCHLFHSSILSLYLSFGHSQLCEAKDNYRLGKLERNLAKADLLILDELSYLSFNRHQSELLFKVISDRSEKSSTIVTTNLPFSKRTELFENTTMVAALIDRLTFRSHVLDMNGDSYRLKATMQKQM